MDKTLAMVLAGGRVDELLCLTEKRPKSALPIFGIYRIIDFALSNLMHSGINNVGILSQYRPSALVRHIGIGEHWDFIGRKRGIRILSPYRGAKASDWYKGTADAVYQNISYIEEFNPKYVLVLSADHIYHMDYKQLLQFHVEKKAQVSVCFTKIKKKTSRFGYGVIDKNDRLTAYQEKPEVPQSNWISMTVYLFKTALLLDVLKANAREKSHEFGRDIIPMLTQDERIYGYRFNDYWAYARTIDSYYQTNMDLLRGKINLQSWQVRTNLLERCTIGDRIPARINGDVSNSVISEGCIVEGKVKNSILSPGVKVASKAEVIDSIIFHDTNIDRKAILKKVICDKDSQIGAYAIVGASDSASSKKSNTRIRYSITVLGKNSIVSQKAIIPANTVLSNPEEKDRK
jgi:glucose-1-phosphate adenylyltransferase